MLDFTNISGKTPHRQHSGLGTPLNTSTEKKITETVKLEVNIQETLELSIILVEIVVLRKTIKTSKEAS